MIYNHSIIILEINQEIIYIRTLNSSTLIIDSLIQGYEIDDV
jgi:hypothetical protein